MNDALIKKIRSEIIEIGKLLWDKNLVTGLNGNISVRVEKEVILITGHGTCLGRLEAQDIILMDLDGNLLEGGQASSERLLHTDIYRNFTNTQAVIHTHTAFTNAYFLAHEKLQPAIFESKVYLGEVKGVEQFTPAVTDTAPVVTALKSNNIMALRNHGIVAMGKNLFDCFVLIQGLEDAVKVDYYARIFSGQPQGQSAGESKSTKTPTASTQTKKYSLFSQEQIDEIVRLVNNDNQLKELGAKTQMNMDLAVKLNETGQVYSFSFKNGNIVKVGSDENAEFLISAPVNIWKAVFNREIDPFVATTQKKMNLRGDFAKISKWYAPCSRIFELWHNVPVE